jgi:peptide/nickel transport system ATP-binding protein
VEQGTTDQIFSPPYHPYTEALLSAIPIADTSVVKKHVVLEGDIPSAMNPPTGCPFQTRCGYKHLVADGLCEKQVPPPKDLGGGHMSRCWLSDEVLATMEPVIRFDAAHAAHEGEPEDAPHGSGPGFAGEPPLRPRGKAGSAEAGELGADAEEDEATMRARRHERRDETSEPHAADNHSGVAPFSPRTLGDGRQSEDDGT